VALLLDEPTAALDSDTALGVARLVGSLAERGLAVLVVTHDAGVGARGERPGRCGSPTAV
jgi:ABC-type lipoprotein export system ATPase subunit